MRSWNDLKASLKNRFAEITDIPQHVLAVMHRTRQNSNESVRWFAERLLQIAEDAYSRGRLKDTLVQLLVDIFCDGLTFDYLRMKKLRVNPKDLESPIQVAMREQNLRQTLATRGSDIL